MDEPRWKPIPGHEDRYEASDTGQIRSLNPQGHYPPTIVLKQIIDRGGYPFVRLYKSGKSRQWRVHRLVLLTFCGEDPERPEGNHIDGNKSNNRLENLEWVTRRNNHLHALRLGLKKLPYEYQPGCRPTGQRNGRHTKPERTARGINHYCAKLTEQDVRDIRQMIANGQMTINAIAFTKHTSAGAVSDIKHGRTWRHVV
jgi:hypothetical protein